MRADDEAIPAVAGSGCERRGFASDEVGEFVGEPFEIGGRGERQLGVDGDREQPRAFFLRPCLHARHVADGGGGTVDQMFRGKVGYA